MDKKSANKLAKVFNKIRGIYKVSVMKIGKDSFSCINYRVRILISHIHTFNSLLKILSAEGIYMYLSDIFGEDYADNDNPFLAEVVCDDSSTEHTNITLDVEELSLHPMSKQSTLVVLDELIDAIESYPFERRSK